jgi:L-cysteine desulfidase
VVGKAGVWLIMNMDILEYLNQECVPALGCTEPASIAYAGMTAAKQITGAPTSLTLTIDPRIYKNCHAVGIPHSGHKIGCALKTMTSVDAAFRATALAMSGMGIPFSDGIVGRTGSESLANLGKIARDGMIQTDDEILKIMEAKL